MFLGVNIMQRPDVTDKGNVPFRAVGEDGFAKKHPLLLSYLQDVSYDDGSSREPSSMSVFVEDGLFKIALNDRDLKRSAYVSADTLSGCMAALEAQLGKGVADWRAWNKGSKKK